MSNSSEPTVWKLGELASGGGPAPTSVDPETNGDLWQAWSVVQNDDVDFCYGHMKGGERIPAHSHPDAAHYTCVVRGTAHLWVEGTIVDANEGDLLVVPVGALHEVRAGQDSDLWVIDLTNPPWDPGKMEFSAERDAEISRAFDTHGGQSS